MNNNYVYRYLNKNNEVIYVGKTIRPLKERVREHKVEKLWEDTTHIDYIECKNEADMNCHERLYINLYKPRYNIADKVDGIPNINPAPYEWNKYWDINDSNLSNDIKILEDMFQVLNVNLFNNKMPNHRITIVKNGAIKRIGFVDTSTSYEVSNNERLYSIEIPDVYAYGGINICSMYLLTCMIDIYCNEYKHIKIDSRQSRYRNKRFKENAESHGLTCKYDRENKNSNGWIPDKVNDYVLDLVSPYELNNVSIYRTNQITVNGTIKRKQSMRKYVDENTNSTVRVTNDKHINNIFCLTGYPDDVKEKISNYCIALGVKPMVLEKAY